ncbi:helix-turn-helix domain-containing protein [Dyella halodurans]
MKGFPEIGIVCDAGTSQTGLHGLTELFRYAGDIAARTQGGQTTLPLRISHWRSGTDHAVHCTYDSHPGTEQRPVALVLPGNLQATLSSAHDQVLGDWLHQKHAVGVIIAAVCGGVFLLARTGLLNGRQATTHWALREQFAKEFPNVPIETDYMVIDYGDVVTAGGVLAWTDLGLRLVERLLGAAVMLETARYMNVDPPGREQRFYSSFDPRLTHGDKAIIKVQRWLVGRSEGADPVTQLAKIACLEQRTFLRRFVKATGMKPLEYQQQVRISRAREMLQFGRSSVDQVARAVGYEDTGAFRRVFRRIVGLTPSDYRRRFSVQGLESNGLDREDLHAGLMRKNG